MSSKHTLELNSGSRFAFGENWSKFLNVLDDKRIRMAELSLREMLEVECLEGKTFLDIGSGSGLFSLAARRLGAIVHSFDYDPQSVECTSELKQRYFPDDQQWKVEQGSVLDTTYLKSLGQWDVVYSWGVLHHTGAMQKAMDNVAYLVRGGGKLFIAIYNNQGRASKMWLRIKHAYNRLPSSLRWLVLWPAFLRLWGPTTARDLLRGRPFETWRHYSIKNSMRGMSPWCNVVDWVGGLPFEVAKPEEIFNFYRDRGFVLRQLKTCAGGQGCNEFVFQAQQA
ncbi:MAG: methyltransferase type 12 [Chloroflexi bacterium RBG_19FT_COMBO_47_9]|nr:MAG: methyltransferase type 12 [Chloroflexi bacterium RBG_19FT_COMBO_47_9]